MGITASITVTTDTRELDALIARFDRIPALIEKYANLIADEARRLVHVKSGDLKASITVVLEGMVAEVTAGEGLTYAAALEYGTSKAAAYPYMRPAAERYFPAFIAELEALIGGV